MRPCAESSSDRTRGRLLAMLLCLATGGAACASPRGAGTGRTTGWGNGSPAPTSATPRVSFAEWEAAWLEDFGATDPRLALRMTVKPSAQAKERAAAEAILRGDRDVSVFEGAIDLFSFEERAARLRVLRSRLGAAPGSSEAVAQGETLLLTRLLNAEDLRVSLERTSPERASDRIRGIVATWGRPASPHDVSAREERVERGLAGLTEDAALGRIAGPRATELEDALDPLERLAVPEGYPRATSTIADLRVELGKNHAKPTPAPASTTLALATRLESYLGVTADEAALAGSLEREEEALRREARKRLAEVPERTARELLLVAATHVDADVRCATPKNATPARSLAPPPERALVCEAVRLVADARIPLEELVVTVTLHDDVAVALWALALAGARPNGPTDLDVTRTTHPLLASVPAGAQDRLVRAALVSPERALAPGLAAALLDGGGPDARHERAEQWLAFGDAPFDVIAVQMASSSSGER